MKELAEIFRTSFHAPDKVVDLFKPTVGELAHKAEREPDAWDDDEWWSKQPE